MGGEEEEERRPRTRICRKNKYVQIYIGCICLFVECIFLFNKWQTALVGTTKPFLMLARMGPKHIAKRRYARDKHTWTRAFIVSP